MIAMNTKPTIERLRYLTGRLVGLVGYARELISGAFVLERGNWLACQEEEPPNPDAGRIQGPE
jgi:hypothetical protein